MYERPQARGCKCQECPLGPNGAQAKPVLPELRNTPTLLMGDYPSVTDTERGLVLSSHDWRELEGVVGKRWLYSLSNAVLCSPGKTPLKDLELKLRAADKVTPTECCAPQAQYVASKYKQIIYLDARGFRSVTGSELGTKALRGSPVYTLGGKPQVCEPFGGTIPTHDGRAMVTFHPRDVQRTQENRWVFSRDMGRAQRFFTDTLRFRVPEVNHIPVTPEAFVQLLDAPDAQAGWWSDDVETDRKGSPMLALLRCIGVTRGNEEGDRWSAVLPLRSLDGIPFWGEANLMALAYAQEAGFLPDEDTTMPMALRLDAARTRAYRLHQLDRWREEVVAKVQVDRPSRWTPALQALAHAFRDHRCWVGHNAGAYDRQVYEQEPEIACAPVNREDTILYHRRVFPRLAHSLDLVGSTLTDVHGWKADADGTKLAFGAHTDLALWQYNALDTIVVSRIWPILRAMQDQPPVQG